MNGETPKEQQDANTPWRGCFAEKGREESGQTAQSHGVEGAAAALLSRLACHMLPETSQDFPFTSLLLPHVTVDLLLPSTY